MAALKAQAVAARSYAMSRTLNPTFAGCDTACGLYQAYEGADVEAAASTGAVMATAGVVRRMSATGRIAPTEYSSSTGGWTVGGTFPAIEDLGDVASPRHEWNASVPVRDIEARYARGTLESISIDQRDRIASSSASWVVTLDEDGQHVPDDIGLLLDRAHAAQVHLVSAARRRGTPRLARRHQRHGEVAGPHGGGLRATPRSSRGCGARIRLKGPARTIGAAIVG